MIHCTLTLVNISLGENTAAFIFINTLLRRLRMNQDINSIIEQLAEIDSASAKIMRQAQKEKSQYAEYINQQKQDFDNSLKEAADKEIEDFKISMTEHNEQLIAQCRIDCNNDINRLKDSFNKDGDQWAEDIFNNIIK